MAGLTGDRNTEYSLGDLLSIPVAAGARIFGGALVCTDAGGYAMPAKDAPGLTFQGIATAQVDNRSGADGAVRVVVRRRGRYRLDCSSTVRQAAMSAWVYALDDHTVAPAHHTANGVPVGVIDRPENSEECWVSIDAAVLQGNPWPTPDSPPER
jgi:hypothetical protein